MSRLWSDPPLKPDGTLDYGRLTLAEIAEDLTETLLDLVENGGRAEFVPLLDALPDVEAIPAEASAPASLVRAMEDALRIEADDPGQLTPEAHATLGRAVDELRAAAAPLA